MAQTREMYSADTEAADEVVLHVSDELLVDGLADARWMLHDALLAGARRIVVDLGAAGQLSSTVLASLLWAHRICRARGGGVVLRGADRRTRDMLGRTGLWRVLRLQSADGPQWPEPWCGDAVVLGGRGVRDSCLTYPHDSPFAVDPTASCPEPTSNGPGRLSCVGPRSP